MCMVNEMKRRINRLEQEKSMLNDQAKTLHMVAHLLGVAPGEDITKAVPEAVRLMTDERDKLLDGYPEGMTPADVDKLKSANAGLAAEAEGLRTVHEHLLQEAQCQAQEARTQRGIVRDIYRACGVQKGDWNGAQPVANRLSELQAQIDHITDHATHAARCQLIREIEELFGYSERLTAGQVIDLLSVEKPVAA